jgi:hypothetical protein
VEELYRYGKDIGAPEHLVDRFLYVQNQSGWKFDDWKFALKGFKARCERDGHGEGREAVGEVPQEWTPKIIPPS